jgi:transposase-like protein
VETVDRQLQRIAQRPVWSEADSSRMVEAWRASGETIAAFARRYGVPPYRMYYWRDRTRERMRDVSTARRIDRTAPVFHPVRVRSSRADASDGDDVASDSSSGVIEIRSIRIPRGIAAADVRVVLTALGLDR